MLPPTSPFQKPPTAPCTAAVLLVVSAKPLNHVALFNCLVKQSSNDVIMAVLHYPAFASTLLGCISATKALPFGAADHTCFISAVNLADFPQIAEQQGMFDALSSLIQSNTLDWSIGDTFAPAKSFFTFADAIITIKSHHCEACQRELQEADPEGKPCAKKIKVLPSSASHKVGSEAALALLTQVDTALDAVALAEDNSFISCADLQKHCNAVNLAAQQWLFLGSSKVDQTSNLFTELQVSPKATDSDSDIELLDPPLDVSHSSAMPI
ncbi:hypothetical protein E4T56_gene1255 [Termitomyces sp. T112]|nr:hypothetical protein E4T56_gene1255 [Termitomyces sp. T112]